jgi:hypothetical protein
MLDRADEIAAKYQRIPADIRRRSLEMRELRASQK